MDGGSWLRLGWRHPLWELIRFYLSLRGTKAKVWLIQLRERREMQVGDAAAIPLDPELIELFFAYLADREAAFISAFDLLRTEKEAMDFCKQRKLILARTNTKNQGT